MNQMCVMYVGGRRATRAARTGRRMEPGGRSARETAPPAWARAPYREWGLWCFESGHCGFSVFGLRAIEAKRAGQPRPAHHCRKADFLWHPAGQHGPLPATLNLKFKRPGLLSPTASPQLVTNGYRFAGIEFAVATECFCPQILATMQHLLTPAFDHGALVAVDNAHSAICHF